MMDFVPPMLSELDYTVENSDFGGFTLKAENTTIMSPKVSYIELNYDSEFQYTSVNIGLPSWNVEMVDLDSDGLVDRIYASDFDGPCLREPVKGKEGRQCTDSDLKAADILMEQYARAFGF